MLRFHSTGKSVAASFLALAIFALPFSVFGQTPIKLRKNKFTIQQDIELGQQAARDAERQLPILNDRDSTAYLQDLGRRLVDAMPPQFQQPEFRYYFKIVNARDINAFALPGGPMYVNRGMIESAQSEGELAGVMAHELAHVALRHGTAQVTKQQSAKTTLITLGSIIGGAVLGGEAGAQVGAVGAAAYVLKFSREYETESDILGAQMMARAGYDPMDLANVFKTIEQQSRGGGAPGFLSSHPNPKDRFERIQKERNLLRISPNPIRQTRELARTQERFRALPGARTMEEISKGNSGSQGGGREGQGNATYSNNVQLPSTRYRTENNNAFSVTLPDNWENIGGSQSEAAFSPRGAYGNQGLTHGVLIGLARTQNRDLASATEEYVQGVLQNNAYLRQRNSPERGSMAGRNAYGTLLSGTSQITGRTEIVTIFTTQTRNGDLFYLITVVPENEQRNYSRAFEDVRRSLRIND
jgi:Zn-dependent protease with chaperone function